MMDPKLSELEQEPLGMQEVYATLKRDNYRMDTRLGIYYFGDGYNDIFNLIAQELRRETLIPPFKWSEAGE